MSDFDLCPVEGCGVAAAALIGVARGLMPDERPVDRVVALLVAAEVEAEREGIPAVILHDILSIVSRGVRK